MASFPSLLVPSEDDTTNQPRTEILVLKPASGGTEPNSGWAHGTHYKQCIRTTPGK